LQFFVLRSQHWLLLGFHYGRGRRQSKGERCFGGFRAFGSGGETWRQGSKLCPVTIPPCRQPSWDTATCAGAREFSAFPEVRISARTHHLPMAHVESSTHVFFQAQTQAGGKTGVMCSSIADAIPRSSACCKRSAPISFSAIMDGQTWQEMAGRTEHIRMVSSCSLQSR